MRSRSEEFREFVRARGTPLHHSAYLLCGDWHLAHDLVQETLVRAYRHWPRVQQADNPDAYVRRILINEARGRWHRRDRAVPVAHFAPEPAVPDVTDDVARRCCRPCSSSRSSSARRSSSAIWRAARRRRRRASSAAAREQSRARARGRWRHCGIT